MQSYQVGSVVIDRYEIKEVLGQGPVGTTYLAFDQEVEVDVALKILAEELFASDGARQDFVEAMEAVREVSHPNLRKFYEVETRDGLVLYTGAYHAGETLKQALQGRKSFTHLEAEPILSQICQALHHAEQRFAHGGIRPENILVLPDSVKVTDLGLAAALSFGTYTATLKKGSASRYLAPEVRRGGVPLNPRADVYSLGVLFYEMLTGEPYEGGNSSLLAKNPVLPPAFDEILKYSLASDPEQRYASAAEFSEDIASVIDTGKIKPRAIIASVAPAKPEEKAPPSDSPPQAAESAPESATSAAIGALEALEKLDSPTKAEPETPAPAEEKVSAPKEEAEPSTPDTQAEAAPAEAPREEAAPAEEPEARAEAPKASDSEPVAERAAPEEKAEQPKEKAVQAEAPSQPEPSPQPPSQDSGDDLFDMALREVREEPRPQEKKSAKPVKAKAPVATPLPEPEPDRDEAAAESPSTELARPSDLPPPVTPPAQGAVIMPGWFAAVLGLGVLALVGVVIYLLVWPRQQPTYGLPTYPVSPTPQTLAAIPNPSETKPTTLEEPPVASTQVTSEPASVPASDPTTLVASNDPATSPTSLSTPGVDPKTPETTNGTDPKTPVNPTPTEPQKKTVCPGGMQKLTHGKEKIEFCIDRYEFPNVKGQMPMTGVDFATAESTCASKGKRLCTAEEWGRACGGAFPYGKEFNPDLCNTKDADGNSREVAAAGSFPKCKAGGVYDMSGNVEEWIAGGVKRGGSAKSSEMFASCSRPSRGGASEFTGFRCCADPQEAP